MLKNLFYPKPINPMIFFQSNNFIKPDENCPNIIWEHDMGATVPYCNKDNAPCALQCKLHNLTKC